MIKMLIRSGLAAFALMMMLTPLAAAQDEGHILNFRQADIRALIDDVALITGEAFIVDPRVNANVTLISREPVPAEDVFDLFLSTLRVYGYTAIPTPQGAYKVVAEEAAMTDFTRATGGAVGDQVVTEVFRLKYVSPLTALNTVKPIINRQGRAIAHRNNSFLLVVDYAANMVRIREILREIDKDPSIVRMISLANTSAEEMMDTITSLRSAGGGEEASDAILSLVPVSSSNTLILRGPEDVVESLVPIVEELDEKNANKGDIRVLRLKYADAEEMKPVLEEVSRSLLTASGQPGGGGGAGSSGSRASISFHKATNTLVISAAADMQKALETVVRELDVPRKQLLVEAIIVEMSDVAAKELGVQYILSGSEGADVPFTAVNYSSTAPNILAATGALALQDAFGSDSTAVTSLQTAAVDSLLGLNGFSAGFAGDRDGVLFGFIINALEQDVASNVLSTPSIMTLDNTAASFQVGQEIPITTGEALGNNNANPFRTIQREDVGILLNVTPRISDTDDIRLDIQQEVSSVAGTVGATSGELITNKSTLQTSVRVGDGEIIVLGGLIQSDERITLNKVPLLGDIPVVGELFKSENKSRTKTNLMVFIRPRLVEDQQTRRDVTARKYGIVNESQNIWGDRRSKRTQLDTILEEVVGVAVPANQAGSGN